MPYPDVMIQMLRLAGDDVSIVTAPVKITPMGPVSEPVGRQRPPTRYRAGSATTLDPQATYPADQFWFLTHHYRTGSPQLGPAGLRLGLAACVLGELLLTRHIAIAGNTIHALRQPTMPAEPYSHEVHISLGQQMPVRDAVRTVGLTVLDGVAERMQRQELVRYNEIRKWHRLGTRSRWIPASSNSAYMPRTRIVTLGQRYPHFEWTWTDFLIVCVADATGPLSALRRDFPETRRGLAKLLGQPTPPAPQIRQLAQATATLLAATSITP